MKKSLLLAVIASILVGPFVVAGCGSSDSAAPDSTTAKNSAPAKPAEPGQPTANNSAPVQAK